MVKTIGNPLTWTAGALGATGSGLAEATTHIGGRENDPPIVREVTMDDLRAALRAGIDDFLALRTDVMAMVLLYPVIGLILTVFAFNANFAPYLFPLASGFALVGPLAALRAPPAALLRSLRGIGRQAGAGRTTSDDPARSAPAQSG